MSVVEQTDMLIVCFLRDVSLGMLVNAQGQILGSISIHHEMSYCLTCIANQTVEKCIYMYCQQIWNLPVKRGLG